MPEQKFNAAVIFERMHKCLGEIADSKGVERCALIYALAQLIDAVQNGVKQNEESYEAEIQKLKAGQDRVPKVEEA